MKKILITGASGLLGINLALTAHAGGYDVTGITLEEGIHGTPFEMLRLDLTQPGTIMEVIQDSRPDTIINCVALTDVDLCEQIPEKAKLVNTWIPEMLAKETAMRHIQLVQISTDAVFDGSSGNYSEDDPVSPQNVYADTKLAGEYAVLEKDKNALVCRVNFYGWSISGRRSLAEWFFNKFSQGESVKGFTDAFFSPLLATDLAEIILRLIEHRSCGLFHVVNPEAISKYAFGLALAEKFGFDRSLLTPASVKEAGFKAARSPNLNLNPGKLIKELGVNLPGQQMEMEKFHQQYLEGYPLLLRKYSSVSSS
jgi:dTDP-4-dehydrorhamnose reductase